MSHRHYWTPEPPRRDRLGIVKAPRRGPSVPISGTYGCAECPETSEACVECSGPTGGSLLACERCVECYRAILDDIASALGWWRHERKSLVPAIRYDREQIRGSRSRTESVYEHPRDIVAALWDWAALWHEAYPADTEPDGEVHQWLSGRILWALHHREASAWEDFTTEVRTLRSEARRLAGLNPQRLGPCMYCGATLVRDWSDESWRPNVDGLSDVVRCSGCKTTFQDRPSQLRATRGALQLAPEYEPEALVTIEQAQLVWPDVPSRTWQTWHRRDHERAERGEGRRIPERGWTPQGVPLYRLGDLAVLVEARADGTRRGPKVKAG